MSRKKKSSVSFGPGAASLILIVVALSLSALGMLSLMNGRNDARLSERSAQVIEAVYRLNADAEEHRAELDALLVRAAEGKTDDEAYLAALADALPEGTELEGAVLSWTESDGSRMLDCALGIQPLGSEKRTVWLRHNLTAETGEVWFE